MLRCFRGSSRERACGPRDDAQKLLCLPEAHRRLADDCGTLNENCSRPVPLGIKEVYAKRLAVLGEHRRGEPIPDPCRRVALRPLERETFTVVYEYPPTAIIGGANAP